MTHLLGELSHSFPALPLLRGVQGCVTFAEKYSGSSYKLDPAERTFEPLHFCSFALLNFCSFELLLFSRPVTDPRLHVVTLSRVEGSRRSAQDRFRIKYHLKLANIF